MPDRTANCSVVPAGNATPPLVATVLFGATVQPSANSVAVTGAVIATSLPVAEQELLTIVAVTRAGCVSVREQPPPTQFNVEAGGDTTTLRLLVLTLPFVSVTVSFAVK